MKYKVTANKHELNSVGIDDNMIGKTVIKIREYWTGYWGMYYQTCENGYYFGFEYDIPKEYLTKI